MPWLSRTIAALLLALWLPATMHCDLETLPGFGFLQTCCGDTAKSCADSGPQADLCSEVESGLYKTEEPFAMPAAPLLRVALPAGLLTFDPPALLRLAKLGVPDDPPSSPRPRPLDLRAAPPARAPAALA